MGSPWGLGVILSRPMGCWRSPSGPTPAVRSHGAALRSGQKDRAEANGSDQWVWVAGRGDTRDLESSFLGLQ